MFFNYTRIDLREVYPTKLSYSLKTDGNVFKKNSIGQQNVGVGSEWIGPRAYRAPSDIFEIRHCWLVFASSCSRRPVGRSLPRPPLTHAFPGRPTLATRLWFRRTIRSGLIYERRRLQKRQQSLTVQYRTVGSSQSCYDGNNYRAHSAFYCV
jgi:hypothetical protein